MKYENKFVLFLDILGFKKIIENTYDKTEDKEEEIQKLFDTLLTLKKIMGAEIGSKKVTQFSDLIVVSFVEKEEIQFMHLLDDISYMLYSLAFRGIICRGAVAYGKFYHDDNHLFGPALVEAYETESKAAIYPRVIFDKSVIQVFKENGKKKFTQKYFLDDVLDKYLKEDLDDKLYIDYFYNPITFADSYDIYLNYLINLRETISQGLSKAKSPDIKVKYGWMKIKFNDALHRVKAYKGNDSTRQLAIHKLKGIKYFR